MNGFENTEWIARRVYRYIGFLLFICCVFLYTSSALAQSAAVSGRVTDPSGAVVSNAEIALIREETREVRNTASNSDGIYAFPFVRSGKYRLTAAANSFKHFERSDVIIETGQAAAIDIRLEIGEQADKVTVDGSGMVLNTVNAAVSTIVDREFVDSVPLNGRTLQSLMTVVPGVVAVPSTEGMNVSGGISVNGQRTEANYFTVDGLSANSGASPQQVAGFGAGHSGSLPATTTLGTTQSIVSLDALEEFRALTSTYSAEHGRTPGGQFTLTTRSGTNDLHGSLYNYLRNDKLNANNWFNNQAGLPRNIERQNDFGGTFGGPVLVPGVYSGRDRTFFFFSYEGMRLRLPQAAQVTGVPTVELRNNAPAAIKPFLNAFPLPNGGEVAEGMADFRTGYSAPASINSTGLRLDHSLNSGVRFFGRYNGAPSSSLTRSVSNLAVVNDVTGNVRTVMGGITASLTPRITLDARANGTWNDGAVNTYMDALGGATRCDWRMCPVWTQRDSLSSACSGAHIRVSRLILGPRCRNRSTLHLR